ncbi:MAG TPA: histone deacetylase [Thermomicrobiales bacterium]|nr:histone deacetylase [Thermomicrobiales bacterium]
MTISPSGPVAGQVFHHRYLDHNPAFMQIPAPNSPVGPWVDADTHPSNHRLVMRTQQLLGLTGLGERLTEISPRPVTDAEILTYHTEPYLRRLEELEAAGGGEAGDGALMGPGSLAIARLAAGGVLAAVDAVVAGPVRRVFANVRPPGHHAMADRGMGFCILGNVALAAHHARAVHGLERVLVLDWDVHHGNGTQDAFYGDPGVLFVSIHQDDHYPAGWGAAGQVGTGEGQGFTVNVPLPAGSGEATYRAAFERVIQPIVAEYAPQLVIVSAGQDASVRDANGRMYLTVGSYRWLTEAVIAMSDATAGGRLVIAQEGGYSESYAPWCTFAIVATLAGEPDLIQDPIAARGFHRTRTATVVNAAAEEMIAEAVATHAGWWPVLRV